MHHGYIYYCSGIKHPVQSPWRMLWGVGCLTVHYSSAAALRTRLTLLLSSPDLLQLLILQKHPEVPAEIVPALLCRAFTPSGEGAGVGGEAKRWSDLPWNEKQFSQEVRDERVWMLRSHTGREPWTCRHLLQLSGNAIPQLSAESNSASKQNELAPTCISTEGHILTEVILLKTCIFQFSSQPAHRYITRPIWMYFCVRNCCYLIPSGLFAQKSRCFWEFYFILFYFFYVAQLVISK